MPLSSSIGICLGTRAAIEGVFDEANRRTGGRRVIACFCGHHHVDRHNRKNGIHYVWVNSASYFWVGEKYGRMAPYRDALYAFVTFRPEGLIEIEGRRSEWLSPSPRERGYPNAESLTPFIADRELRTTVSPQSP